MAAGSSANQAGAGSEMKTPRFKRYAIIAGKVVEGLANAIHLDVPIDMAILAPSDTPAPHIKTVRYAMPRCFQFRTREEADKALKSQTAI